jgi:hypothetical protein
MNIFFLHNEPSVCAQQHVDRHCVKMILEYAQLLSTAHHEFDSYWKKDVYKPTHRNHPCAIWVRESANNYMYLYTLFTELCKEYTHRYGKVHKTDREKSAILFHVPDGLQFSMVTKPPQCFSGHDEYKEDDHIQAYRKFYNGTKSHLFTLKDGSPAWKNRPIPDWIDTDKII